MTAPKPTQRRRRAISPKARERFLEALAAGWAVRHAASLTTYSFQRWYELREADEEFAAAWSEAIEQGTQRIEDEALRRAVDGWDEPVFQKGELVGHVRRYSDAILALLLRARRPETYREGAIVDMSTTVHQLHIAPDPEQSARMLEKLQAVGLLTHVPEAQVLELTEGEGE